MSNDDIMMKVAELPDELLGKASMAVHSFSTLLIKIPKNASSIDDVFLIGSGTFVSAHSIFGLLTATHVVRELERKDELGIVLVEGYHRFSIEVQYLIIKEIGEYITPGKGPDLTFIQLPNHFVSQIRPYKSFLNLSHDRESVLSDQFDHHDGFWFVCGAPDELTSVEDFKTIAFTSICGAGGVINEFMENGYDYLESLVEYVDHEKLPKSFGGVSGGGLWRIRFRILPNGEFEPVDYIFCGVPFFQTPYEDNRRRIKCHGIKSVYEHTYNEICALNPALC